MVFAFFVFLDIIWLKINFVNIFDNYFNIMESVYAKNQR